MTEPTDAPPPAANAPKYTVVDYVFSFITITAGVLIALLINGLVQWNDNRELVAEARATINREIADNKKELAEALGIVSPEEGVAYRATFIIDPDNVIQHVTVNGLNVGRNPAETLRVLDALQTDELCPCNWSEGEEVLRPAA